MKSTNISVATAFPEELWVNEVLEALENVDGMSLRELEQSLNLRYGQIEKVLKVLSVDNPAPVLRVGQKWRRTPVRYRIDRTRINRLAAQKVSEWQQVLAYIGHPACLMQFLAEALDDPSPEPCGKCSNCIGDSVVDTSISSEVIASATRFLRRGEMPLLCNKQVAKGSFLGYGWTGNISESLRAETGRIMSRWGDAGWGRVVADEKRDGHFSDELVEATAEMIKVRWRPDPWPRWVTCVPSNRTPTLVPDFASRLAAALSIPFVQAVRKVKDNEPQKEQQNRFHQCRNLDGAFAVDAQIPVGAVLLIDDIVDSNWTLTVGCSIASTVRLSDCMAVCACIREFKKLTWN